jgi:hypothetical protein
MAINARRKVYLYPVKHRTATVIGIISIPTCPIARATLKTMHHALVIRTVKQTAQLFRKKVHRDVTAVQPNIIQCSIE